MNYFQYDKINVRESIEQNCNRKKSFLGKQVLLSYKHVSSVQKLNDEFQYLKLKKLLSKTSFHTNFQKTNLHTFIHIFGSCKFIYTAQNDLL